MATQRQIQRQLNKVRAAAKVPTPELDKMAAVRPQSQAIGQFLDWLDGQGIVLARYHQHDDEGCLDEDGLHTACGYEDGGLQPEQTKHGKEGLMARHFNIDLVKVEKERRALLRILQDG